MANTEEWGWPVEVRVRTIEFLRIVNTGGLVAGMDRASNRSKGLDAMLALGTFYGRDQARLASQHS